jgi:hypothetical protein
VTVIADETLLFTPARPDPQAVPLIFAFPSEYSVGITSLGYQVVWATLAARPDLAVSRLFMDAAEPLPRQPELLGFSVSWELDYVNILALLERLQVPIRAAERQAHHPLVFGGGPVLTANPEPFADFFDVVLIGDGEVLLDAFIDAYQPVRDRPRSEQLQYLAQTPGLYVPSLYRVEYEDPEGPIRAIALLVLAQWTQQPRLGQSSWLTFTLSAFKVLAYDLRDGESLVRVVVLRMTRLYRRLNGCGEAGDRPSVDEDRGS